MPTSQPKSNVKHGGVTTKPRKCPTCGEVKPAREFEPKPGCKGGRRPICRPCGRTPNVRRRCSKCSEPLNAGSRGGVCQKCLLAPKRPLFERLEQLWANGLTVQQIADTVGLTLGQTAATVKSGRYHGYQFADRKGGWFVPPQDEIAPVVKQFKKETPRGTDGRYLTDKQKIILRLLQAAPEPLSVGALGALCCALNVPFVGWDHTNMSMALNRLRKRGLAEKVPAATNNRWSAKIVWLVPALPDRIVLTLDDARAEKELAKLIAAQEREIRRGEWADTDFRTTSLDAERGAHGVTLHEFLEDVA